MALYGKEKIFYLINRILDQREITPKGELIGLHPAMDLHQQQNYDMPELLRLFEKLEKDDKAIKLVGLPVDQNGLRYQIELLSGFDRYMEKLRQDPDYQDWMGIKPEQVAPEVVATDDGSNSLTVTYTKAREIVLNGIFQLAKPTLNGENDTVFQYLYNNSNQKFTKVQLETALNIKITKPLHKIVENLGFKSDLNRAFFSVAKTSIEFRNPVTKEELDELGITRIKLWR